MPTASCSSPGPRSMRPVPAANRPSRRGRVSPTSRITCIRGSSLPGNERADTMSADVSIGEGGNVRLTAHPLRAAVLGEVHARPFTPIETPRRVLHFAFDTTAESGEADRAALGEFCSGRGLPAPKPGSKHHRVVLGATILRWEQHSEFTTYTWELPSEGRGALPFYPPASALAEPMALVPQPGPLLVAVDLL